MVAALGMTAMLFAYGAATAAPQGKDELPDIKTIMKKGHAKTDGYIALTKTAAKDGKWDDAVKYAKTLEVFGEALGKNKPGKGDAESWKKLTDKYAAATKAALKGAEAKDAKAVNTALGMINCGECHKVHK
jgi:hypothetical protein